jgi:hypothetical protein
METQTSSIEALVDRAGQYGKTSIELYRLKAIDKSADVVSSLVTKLAVIIFFTLFFLVLNIGVALWLGDVLGKSYLGFFIVAGFYAISGIVLYVFRNKWIKVPLRNSIIIQALN